MHWKLIFFIALVSYGGYQHFSHRPILHGNGIIAGQQPIQLPIQLNSGNQQGFTHNGYHITPLEDFSIEARVLAAKEYTFGRGADLVPVSWYLLCRLV